MASVARNLSQRDFDPIIEVPTNSTTTAEAETSRGPAEIVELDYARKAWHQRDMPRWLMPAFMAISEFTMLPKNWDTYGAEPLRLDTGMFVLNLLGSIMNPRLPMPMLVPLGSGGVQIEWQQDQIEIEFSVSAPYQCELIYRDGDGNEEAITLTTDFGQLGAILGRLKPLQRLAS